MPKRRWAMSKKYDALEWNRTWELVPPNFGQNFVGCKWSFQTKCKSNGSVDIIKGRLVVKGYHQRPGIDYNETFNPVVNLTIVYIIYSIKVTSRHLDINNVFLQGHLFEHVYMAQPHGFVDSDRPSYVCKLHKSHLW